METMQTLDMLTDGDIVAYLATRGWQVNVIDSPDGRSIRRILWSPWEKTVAGEVAA